jgi:hypothetical protein
VLFLITPDEVKEMQSDVQAFAKARDRREWSRKRFVVSVSENHYYGQLEALWKQASINITGIL